MAIPATSRAIFTIAIADDIALMAELGLNAARISLSWPRIMPDGKGAVNQKGLDFYRRVVDEMLARNIQPWVTLYHWDLPQALEDAGGWPNRDLAEYFRDYAAVVADALGDRVKHWMAFNEPWIFTILGYHLGIHAPGRRDIARGDQGDAYGQSRAGHGVQRASRIEEPVPRRSAPRSACRRCIRRPGRSRIATAAERWHRFYNMWFLDTVMHGKYPEAYLHGTVEDHVEIRAGDMDLIKAPLDFIGINLYTRAVVAHDPSDHYMGVKQVQPGGEEVTDFGWEVYPQALSEMIMRIAQGLSRQCRSTSPRTDARTATGRTPTARSTTSGASASCGALSRRSGAR